MKRLLPVVALLLSLHASAQSVTDRNYPAGDYLALKFGVLDAVMLTTEQIVANAKLSCKESGCEVLSYEVRIGRRGKDYYGPYYVKGSEFPSFLKDMVADINVNRGTIYFENIHVKYHGEEMVLPDEYSIAYRK